MSKMNTPDPAFPFSIERIEGNRKILDTTDGYQILRLNEGKVFYKRREGLKIFTEKGFFLIPPKLNYRLRFDTGFKSVLIIIGDLLFQELESKVDEVNILTFSKREVSFFTVHENEHERYGSILEGLFWEYSEKRDGYRDIIRLKLAELLINLVRQGRDDRSALFPHRPAAGTVDISVSARKIDDILTYIRENFAESLSLDDLAARLGFSSSYFSRYFRNKTGVCLFEYINKLRIRQACLLLKKSSATVLEIALTVGYNNVSFFNRYFRKVVGMPPLEYRNKMRVG